MYINCNNSSINEATEFRKVKFVTNFFLFTISIVCSEYTKNCTKYSKHLYLPSTQKFSRKKRKKEEHKKNQKNKKQKQEQLNVRITYNKSVILFQIVF